MLPRGGGIVFRHYGWPTDKRLALFRTLEALCRRRGLLLVASRLRRPRGGVHRPCGDRARAAGGLVTAAAHDRREVIRAFAQGADLVFLSPVFPTRSHPGAPTLGPMRFGLIARAAPGPVLALGGVGRREAAQLKSLGAFGFGAIDYWLRPRHKAST